MCVCAGTRSLHVCVLENDLETFPGTKNGPYCISNFTYFLPLDLSVSWAATKVPPGRPVFGHTPSIAFRHLPPNSARFSYATEGALFISAQLSTDAVSALRKVRVLIRLQALVYDIFPSTTAVFSYAIGSRKLSANEQLFVGAQTVVSLLQTTQIKQGVSFIAANKVYTSTNKTTIV